jgi:hypothetical protein
MRANKNIGQVIGIIEQLIMAAVGFLKKVSKCSPVVSSSVIPAVFKRESRVGAGLDSGQKHAGMTRESPFECRRIHASILNRESGRPNWNVIASSLLKRE